jgi:hypothetical protein
MPKRIAVHTVVVMREGKRIEILPNKGEKSIFDFTADEVKELEALKAVRKIVVEDPEAAALLAAQSANAGGPELSEMTVANLKALAEEKGIDLGEATKKDDIIAAIQAGTKTAEDADL